RNDDEGGHLAGAVYTYRLKDGAYQFHRKLLGPTEPFAREFGADVAIEGDLMAVGSASADGAMVAQGAVYIFELSSDEWYHTHTLQHDDPKGADALGASVMLHGGVVISGAPRYEIPELTRGVAYAFHRAPDGSWRQAAK